MLSVSRLAEQRGRQHFALVLLVLGLLLVPVQCSLGLHSIFIASSSLIAATPVAETPHHHSADQHAPPASDAPDGPRSSASEQRSPSPVTSMIVDHLYTVALSRFVASVGSIATSLPLVIGMPPVPDAVSVTPESPPPRDIA